MSRTGGLMTILGLAATLAGCSAAPLEPTIGRSTQPSTSIPAVQPTSRPTDRPSPAPSLLSTAPVDTPIAAGSYQMPLDYTPVAFVIDVPEGWSTNQGYLFKGGDQSVARNEVKFATWSVLSHVFADICSTAELIPAGDSAAEFISALANQGHRELPDRGYDQATTVDGHPALRIALTTPSDLDCGREFLRVWPDPGPDLNGGFLTFNGRTDEITALDIRGSRLVMIVSYSEDVEQANLDEVYALVDSIQFIP